MKYHPRPTQAERVGFEPTEPMRFTRFRNARLKPLSHRSKAGTEGFEPPARSDRTTAFKTAALNHSATYPKRGVPERTERSRTPLIIRTRPLKGTETRREHLHGQASTGSGIRTRTTTILSRLPLPIGPHRRTSGSVERVRESDDARTDTFTQPIGIYDGVSTRPGVNDPHRRNHFHTAERIITVLGTEADSHGRKGKIAMIYHDAPPSETNNG